ncbi:ABC transporter substrate-binding protein [Kyrpidia tusciae]|uniref:Extracellular solute-binding protein family 3 n=1 Tax=Kyrpidia tusciae (strain DSM 2912 / NBRC 15312 / T2) TaxID=562970 RepID=D5WUA2_KYRT2|nr:ABC transporter substrate-binding protein [Kyrpidia tusciae]ADG07354.1 extracellular solute-binding protein family 3 [Kyrpidia tusciae DSM 2912]
MKRTAQRLLFWAALCCAVVIAGCGTATNLNQGSSGSEGEPKPLKTVKVGYNIGALVLEAFLEPGIEQGFFKKEGFDLKPQGYGNGGQIMQDLVSGNIDIGLAGISPALNAAAQGADVLYVSSFAKNDCPLVARTEIKTIQDLNGKTVGTLGLASIQETMLNYLEKKYGIRTKHVYGNQPSLAAMYQKGEVQAVVAGEPVAAQIVHQYGGHYLMDTVIPDAEAAGVVVKTSFAKNRPDDVVAFLRAVEETSKYITSHLDEVANQAAQKTGLTPDIVKEAMERSKLFQTPLTVSRQTLGDIIQTDIESGKLKGIQSNQINELLNKAIDESFLQKALSNK